MAKRSALKRQSATEAWVRRGLLDFFAAYELSYLTNIPLFCLHQGVEKLCKAYLIASQAHRYEHLKSDKAVAWVDSFARSHGHNLANLLGLVSIGLDELKSHLLNRSFIDLLMMAFEEGRYPTPPSKTIAMKHGYSALVTHRNQQQAFALGAVILKGIEEKFHIPFPLKDDPPYPMIPLIKWQKFMVKWNQSVRE